MKKTIKNISNSVQCIHGFTAFSPGEVRQLPHMDAEYILANPFFSEIIDVPDTEEGSKNESLKKAKQKETQKETQKAQK